MCGILAFIGSRPDSDLLRRLAIAVGRRGPHACGWAWMEAGELRCEKRLGSLAEYADELPPSSIVLGHSRLATSGGDSYRNLDDAQPIMSVDTALVHNGVASVAYDGPLATGCDSEKLLRWADQEGFAKALRRLPESEPYAGVYATKGWVEIANRGLPLFIWENNGGTYLSSVAFAGSQRLDGYRRV